MPVIRRRTGPPRRTAAAAALALAVLTIAGCGDDGPSAGCRDEAQAEAAPGPALANLRLERLGTVTAAREQPGLSTVTVVSPKETQTLVAPVRAAIVGAGYTVLAEENEGFEADFVFNGGPGTHGIARISDNIDCDVRQIQFSVARTPVSSGTPGDQSSAPSTG